ncbi:MAG: hypothetical protein ACKV1O_26965 [Saprospiraceae bacterium]
MKMMKPQYITDTDGKKLSVILPLEDYVQLIEALEDLEDIRLYDEAKADKTSSVPIEIAIGHRKDIYD